MKVKNPIKLFDKGIWISDDRITSFISSECNGIAQIDYHGKQPVSRNARVFMLKEGVLKFRLELKIKQKTECFNIKFEKFNWSPNGVLNSDTIDKIDFLLMISTCGKSLICSFQAFNRYSFNIELSYEVLWYPKSLTKDVHGERVWKDLNLHNDRMSISANDRIYLNEWIERKGEYQGDFLIPEAWRRMILKTRKISGQANFDDLKEEYKKKNLVLYDADIFTIIGGTRYNIIRENEESIIFKNTRLIQSGKTVLFDPFVISFGDSEDESTNNFIKAKRGYFNLIYSKMEFYDKMIENNPSIYCEGYEGIKDLFNTIPGIIESAVVTDIKMTRACSSSYYWIWAWDNLVTGHEVSKWNNLELQRGIIDFIRTHRDIDSTIPQRWTRSLEPMDSRKFGGHDFLFAMLVFQYYYNTHDTSILRENYPILIYSFEQIYNSSNHLGFYQTLGMYPDLPKKLGRTEESYTAIDIAALYSFSTIIGQLAVILDDPLNLKKAETLRERLKNNFLNYFFDPEKKFIVDSLDKNLIQKKTFPLFTLLFLNYSPGISLIRERLEEIAKFVDENHFEKNGIALIPAWDSNRVSEHAMPSWYPYWDTIAVKLFRRTGNTDALKRWIKLVERCYKYFGFCPEYASLQPEKMKNDKWTSRGTPWNLNCSAGWYHAIITALFGLEEDIGGITYIPVPPFIKNLQIKNIFLRGVQTDIFISGHGPNIKLFEVNDQRLDGCLKIPGYFFKSKKLQIRIIHYAKDTNLLVKEMNGAEINFAEKKSAEINIRFKCFGHIEIIFSSKTIPNLNIDEEPVSFIWNEKNKSGIYNSFLTGEHNLKLSI